MRAPVIGISATLEVASSGDYDELSHMIPRAYVDAVHRAGGVALLLPAADRSPDDVVELVDGLLLAGGADIDPASYGAQPHPLTQGMVPERDAFEIALAKTAIEENLPTVGVCRGMQLINVARGGTLLQDIPETHGHDGHRPSLGTFAGADHDVRIAPGTLAARVIGSEVHTIKSHHHQGVDRVGAGLQVSAWSERDELPEALEMPGRRFVLGVQWHPEADPTSPVIDALVRAARGGDAS